MIAVCALTLAACGGGASTAPAREPVLQAAFGSPDAPAHLVPGEYLVDIRVFNYSNAQILDMGLRPFGSNGPFTGQLMDHNPVTYGLGINGGILWQTVPNGGYQFFIETDKGRLDFSGFTPEVELPNGSFVPGPAHIYLWSLDFTGRVPGGGGPILP